jgi:RNA polymerase sigma-70 factor (ECF subfamily)
MRWLHRKPRVDGSGSDEESMRRVRITGDPHAFARLVARWESPVRRLCVRMTGDEHRGEDLAQEAFARIYANRHRYEDGRPFSTWLWRIALNLCYESSRRAGIRGERPLDEREDRRAGGAGPHERAVASERAALVREALARLPEAHRAVVVLRQYQNLKFREIADVLDVPEGTVKWRMTEALDRLADELKPLVADDQEPAGPTGSTGGEHVSLPTKPTTKVSVAL